MLTLKKLANLACAALFAAAAVLAPVQEAIGGGITSMPSTAPFNEPNQEVATFNAFIQYLNGIPGSYTAGAVPPIASLGSFASASGGSPQTANAQRVSWALTGITVTTTGSTQVLTLNDSVITAASLCRGHWATAFTAGSAMVVSTVAASAGALSITIANAGTTSNAVTTGTLLVNCDQ